MADIREKIKKLLSLATSPNENEARDALLKAKELMAKNKLSESDFEDAKNRELIQKVCNNITFTTDSGNVWMTKLCQVLADNYCCSAGWRTPYKTRTHILVIAGIGDDVDLCHEVISYAVGFVKNAIKKHVRRSRGDSRTIAKSYAEGFIMGLEFAFEEQKEEQAQEWGLVMVKPEEVQKYELSLGSKTIRTKKTDFDPFAYMLGQEDGRNFSAKQQIGSAV